MAVVICRVGTCSSEQNKHRPVVVKFQSVNNKHTFLKYAKQLKPAGIKWDDYLTRQQQKERQGLAADLQTLREKGYKPFFRGSQLKYRTADRPKTAGQDMLSRLPQSRFTGTVMGLLAFNYTMFCIDKQSDPLFVVFYGTKDTSSYILRMYSMLLFALVASLKADHVVGRA